MQVSLNSVSSKWFISPLIDRCFIYLFFFFYDYCNYECNYFSSNTSSRTFKWYIYELCWLNCGGNRYSCTLDFPQCSAFFIEDILGVFFYYNKLHKFPITGLYNLERNNLFCRIDGDMGGVTQVMFSSCGTKLFSGSRKVLKFSIALGLVHGFLAYRLIDFLTLHTWQFITY